MKTLPGALVSGQSHPGEGPESQIFNPATGEMIATFKDATDAQVDAAVSAARARFDSGEWSRASVAERQAVLLKLADAIEAHGEELAQLETQNCGIILSHTRGMHIPRAAYNFRFFAEFIGQAEDALYDQDANFRTHVRRFPVGVAALIAPWNAPIALGSMKIAAAICFGNSCVIKPSEQAPLGIMRLVEILQGAGLPDNVVNVVNGRGASVGDALVKHPQTSVVSFTGGTATGKAIMAAAGAGLKPSTMELGGKSANIIFADADLDRALDGALVSIYANNGQQCLAGSRILVESSIAEDFIARFVERARTIKVGDPADPATEMGPMASKAHMQRVLSFVESATGEGAELLTGGNARPDLGDGYYIDPIAVRAPSNAARVCQDEIFGPFAAFLTFDTQEEAFALANGTDFGLVSYIWSENINRIMAAEEALNSGVVWVNMPMMRELRAPFGGYGASGVGAEGGKACQALYTREKTITIPRAKPPLPALGKLA